MRHVLVRVGIVAALAAIVAGLAVVGAARADDDDDRPNSREAIRFSTFNASLNRNAAGQLVEHLSTPDNAQAKVIAEIVQRNRPDVLLVNEFDFDPMGTALRLFQTNYLSKSQNGAQPIVYPYRFTAPSNTGIASGFDLNNNGAVVTTPGAPGYGDDALGFGAFVGQFGMAVYSKYPIRTKDVRTFQKFLWKDMPNALLPDDPATPGVTKDWYSPAELAIFRLSSKSHWDIPIRIRGRTVHFLTSHPTPPVFDGPEDRNGTRNFDEIRLWADYVSGGRTARYIYDDKGKRGGLERGARFVIAGDQNSDPFDGDSIDGSAQLLLEHPRVNAGSTPTSLGAIEQSAAQGQQNATHVGNPAFDTADFADNPPFNPGNLRVDYVLPSRNMQIVGSAVFWPRTTDPFFDLVGLFPFPSSDHKLVWADVRVSGGDDDDEDDDDD
jgi:Endonuclease/Exonuclease/phosphatase family